MITLYLAPGSSSMAPHIALVVDGMVLTEVAAILFFIARRFPGARLMPPGYAGEAQTLSWMSFLASAVNPATYKGGEDASAALRRAEERLGNRTWAVGEEMSIADIHLFRLFWRNHRRVPLSRLNYPALWAHHDRMIALPAVVKTCEIEAAIGYELPA